MATASTLGARPASRSAGRWARYDAAMTAADTPLQQLAAAFDLLRCVLADHAVPDDARSQATTHTFDYLLTAARRVGGDPGTNSQNCEG